MLINGVINIMMIKPEMILNRPVIKKNEFSFTLTAFHVLILVVLFAKLMNE